MRNPGIFLALLYLAMTCPAISARAQQEWGKPPVYLTPADTVKYAVLIKGGRLVDPKNNIDAVMDIAVKNGRVALVARHIDPASALQVVEAKGMYVMPGLIDIHEHVFYGIEPDHTYGNGPEAIIPDGFSFRTGVTTIVDAGSSGWKTFSTFKRQIIDRARTRVLVFLNIVGEGMRGGVYEQDNRDMDAKMTALTARANRNIVVGVKLAHYSGPEWMPVDETVKAGSLANMPVMIDFGGANPPLSIEELFTKHLRPGDIFTHCFGELNNREALVDIHTRQLKPFIVDAQKRGIAFDIGYGEISFAYSQAIPALKAGFSPNSISTDIHQDNVNAAMKDMLNTMSKMMAIGMSLDSVISASTWNPAKEIRHEELGNLSVGAIADIAILSLREGRFGFFDYTGYKVEGRKKFECEMTLRDGKIVYDLNGIADPIVAPRLPPPPPPLNPPSAAAPGSPAPGSPASSPTGTPATAPATTPATAP